MRRGIRRKNDDIERVVSIDAIDNARQRGHHCLKVDVAHHDSSNGRALFGHVRIALLLLRPHQEGTVGPYREQVFPYTVIE